MKWVRRILRVVLVLLLSLLIFALICHHLLHGRPDWYGRSSTDPQQREEAASRVEDKLVDANNWSAATFLAKQRLGQSRLAGDALEISLTEEELNAVTSKWAPSTSPFTDPQIMLPDGQIVLAVYSKQLDEVITVQLEPRIDEQGMLQLRIAQVLGGRLPLPEGVWKIYARRLAAVIAAGIANEQTRAKMSEDGSVNDDMVSAVLGRTMLHILDGQSAKSIFFIPFVQNNRTRNLPVKLTVVQVENKTLTIRLRPLDDRDAVIDALNE